MKSHDGSVDRIPNKAVFNTQWGFDSVAVMYAPKSVNANPIQYTTNNPVTPVRAPSNVDWRPKTVTSNATATTNKVEPTKSTASPARIAKTRIFTV